MQMQMMHFHSPPAPSAQSPCVRAICSPGQWSLPGMSPNKQRSNVLARPSSEGCDGQLIALGPGGGSSPITEQRVLVPSVRKRDPGRPPKRLHVRTRPIASHSFSGRFRDRDIYLVVFASRRSQDSELTNTDINCQIPDTHTAEEQTDWWL